MEWYINIFFIIFILLLAFSYITNFKITLFCDGCQEETWWYRCSKGSGLGTKTCEARKMMQPLINVAEKFSKFSFSFIKMAIFTITFVIKVNFRLIFGIPFIIWQMFKDIGCVISKACQAKVPKFNALSKINVNWKVNIKMPGALKDMVKTINKIPGFRLGVPGDINADFGKPINGAFKKTDEVLFKSVSVFVKILQTPCHIFSFIGKALTNVVRPVIYEINEFIEENVNRTTNFLEPIINSIVNLFKNLFRKLRDFIWNKTILLVEKILPSSIKEFFITLFIMIAGIIITILFFIIMIVVSIIQSSMPSF